MFCSKCGKQNKDNSIYCASCGNKLIKPTIYSENVNPKTINKSKFESFVGKNILSILAAILIFIGLITFGVLVFKDLGNLGKTIVMYIVSTLLTGTGVFLAKKNKSSVSSVVLGIGIGSLYISTFVSLLFLDVFNLTIMMIIMSLLTILTLFMSKILKNNDFSVISFIGLALTTLSVLSVKILPITMLCLVVFAVLSFLLFVYLNRKEKYFCGILIGYFFEFTFLHFLLSAYDSTICFTHYNTNALYTLISVLLTFGSMFMCLSMLIYKTRTQFMKIFAGVLTSFSIIWLLKDFLVNNILHFIKVIIDNEHIVKSYSASYEVFYDSNIVQVVNLFLSNIFVPLIFFALLFLIKKIFKSKEEFNEIIIPFTIMYSFYILFSDITMFSILPLLLVSYLYLRNKNNIYYYISLGISITLAFSLVVNFLNWNNYDSITITRLIVCMALICFISVVLPKIKNNNWLSQPLLLTYLAFLISLCLNDVLNINADINNNSSFYVMLCFSLFITDLSHLIKNNSYKAQGIILDVIRNVFAWVVVLLANSCFGNDISSNVIIMLSTIFAIPLMLFVRYDRLNGPNQKLRSVCYSFKMMIYAVLVFSLVSDGLNIHINQLLVSTVFIALFALYVLFGFKTNNKTFRIFGLIALICSIFKLVVIDMWGESSLIRVGALIVGGLICLGISMLYSKIEKNYSLILQPVIVPAVSEQKSKIQKLSEDVINTYNTEIISDEKNNNLNQ